ncbi:hypothetical protein BKA67DRAFT_685634 [Truncatella angustata]|uniref:Protein bir1 n=1 Tax=Truncatella angustata TaxID=152316 RepID=A0A9P9A109_9PEZI|nr:uncharacterized protein BKA67DRAFT_685634 [Truncatella angustata]KAH6659026.1 hypothetical protein BKA67DRAFT_685634 [Truncatella angustata]
MEEGDVPEHYYTQEGRLASFHSTSRKPTAKGKASKSLTWPHKRIEPTDLARAGFYFDPTPDYPDNAVCFLCHKMIGGWEDGDDPLQEHLRLSPHCGWAIVTAIEAALGDYNADDPSHPDMMQARKATFAQRWPHEAKRGWKCKTKQMVDAGWKYTPTLDSDDMATCTYCQLALDGWEPSDKPMNEHYKRSPECPFFILINQYQQAPAKKTGRGKGARSSKASRLSSQSIATTTSETSSMVDQPADYEDSIMTTASVATTGGTKRGRAKKATTAKPKKTTAKKNDHVDVLQDPPEEDLPLPPPPPKPTRGRKRASDSVDDSVLTNAEAPAPKKRATRTRGSNAADSSVIEPQPDSSMLDAFPASPAKTTKKKGSRASKSTRKVSTASTASNASFHNAEEELPDDEELDRQLQADLDRPLSDDDGMIAADSDSERKPMPAKTKAKKATTKKPVAAFEEVPLSGHAMFDPTPADINSADVSVELQELREQIQNEAKEQAPLPVPKKGRKAGTRKVSKQTKTKKSSQPEPEPELVPEQETGPIEQAEPYDISIASNATVLKNSTSTNPAPKKRGRPKKNSTQPPPPPPAPAEPEPQPEPERDIEETQLELPPEVDQVDFADPLEKAATPRVSLSKQPRKKSLPPPPVPEDELQAPATPGPAVSPAPTAKQATISPSQSPQSSDAENQPPSSKPSNTANSSRVALAPVASTPVRSSPSKRNVNFVVGLESDKPWASVELDTVFEQLGKENALPGSNLLKGLQLTSPEKKMTVEEWIYHNANLAEQRLKVECETVVSKFETEGGRAMQSLEGLTVEE